MTIEDLLDDAGAQYVKEIRDNLASTGTDATGVPFTFASIIVLDVW